MNFRNSISPEDGDFKAAIFGAALLFLIVAAFVVLKTIREASFLSTHPAHILPRYMALNTIVSALIAFLLLRLFKFISLRRLLQIALLTFAIGTTLFWELFPFHIQIKPTIFYIWVGIYGTIVPVLAWTLVSIQLSSRQGKRILGWIGSGAILGGIAGGFLARELVIEWGLQSLYPCAALFLLPAIAVSSAVSGSLAETTPPETVAADQKKIGARYVLFLVLIVAISTIVSTFLDFQFKAYTQREYQSETKIGAFVGTFYGLLGVATFVFQLLVTPIMLKRVGLTPGLAAMPFLLFIGSSALYIRKSFAAVVMLRGSEELLRHSLDRSSFEVVQLAMPAYQKMKLKSLLETVGNRLSELIGCAILLVLFTGREMPLTTLTILNMMLTFLWFFFALLLGLREYPRLLRDQLRREELDFEEIRRNLFSDDFHRTLPVLLRTASSETILRILEVLESSDRNWLAPYLVSHQNADPLVRLKTLKILFLQKGDMTRRVRNLLSDPDPAVRAEAVHYVLIRSHSPERLVKSLKKEEEHLAMRAVLCFPGLKSGLREASDEFENILKIAEDKQDETALQEIAHILQFLPPAEFSIKIFKQLLSTSSIEVRKAALRSIGFVKPRELIPILLKLTRAPAIRAEVHAALNLFGKRLIPRLEEIISNPGESTPRRKLALKIAAEAGGQAILESIIKTAEDRDVSLRFSAIKTLNQFRNDGHLSPDHPALQDMLDREISLLELELKRATALAPQPNGLFFKVLKQQILWTIERIFRLLGLIFPSDTIYHAYLAWKSEDLRKRDAGIELLDQTLTPDLRDRLLPFLESGSPETVVEQPEESRSEAFDSLIRENDPLAIAAFLLEMNETEWNQYSTRLQHHLAAKPNILIEETIKTRFSVMQDDKNQALTVLQKLELLSKIDLFSHLSPQELMFLSEVATEVEFESDTIIYKEGDPSEQIYTLIQGQVQLSRETKSVRLLGPGESFGIIGVLTGRARIVSATVTEKAHCLSISGKRFWEILEDYPPIGHGVIEVLAQKIEDLVKEESESHELL